MDNFSFNRKSMKSNSNSIKPFGKNVFAKKSHFGQNNNKFSFNKTGSSTTTSKFQTQNNLSPFKKENAFSKSSMNRFNNKLGKGSNLSYGSNNFSRANTSALPKRLGNTKFSSNTLSPKLGQKLNNFQRPSFSESSGFRARFNQNNVDSKRPIFLPQEEGSSFMPNQKNRLSINRSLNTRPVFNRTVAEPVDYEEEEYNDNEYHDSHQERTPFASHNIRRPINIEKRDYEPRFFNQMRDMHREHTPDGPFKAGFGSYPAEEFSLRERSGFDKKKPINLTNLHALALESVYEDVQDASEDLHSSKFYNIFGNCNVKILSDHTYKISLEAAGYTKADMKIILNPDDTLVVFGELKYPDKDKYIHIGLLPKFYKSFILGKNSAVLGASLEHGVLSIDIKEQDDDKRNTATIPIT